MSCSSSLERVVMVVVVVVVEVLVLVEEEVVVVCECVHARIMRNEHDAFQ